MAERGSDLANTLAERITWHSVLTCNPAGPAAPPEALSKARPPVRKTATSCPWWHQLRAATADHIHWG
eukprot:3424234-Alexandrium_andersonii.AAC.1